MEYFEFIETPTFFRKRERLLDDDTYRELQEYLLCRHFDGNIIRNTGGCKKLRWCRPGIGKRAGVRVIYYTVTRSGKIYLLTLYAKNVKDDLNECEKAFLKKWTEQLDNTVSYQQIQKLGIELWIKNFLTNLCKAWKRWLLLRKVKCNPLAFTVMRYRA
ncbi:MAG TPA: type II toxin-antitoxin system RelE/ParE family toxin [Buttiauxella sp.]|nr:type II toxin-antitoxin system RelE/ParE family toxin [Buttiauxella sp.]HKM97892.1 type II toxin-antitoxin system RelE/ParE family toxin [Buttiauxella sp.]